MKAILTRLFNHEELTSEETKQILLNITKEMYPEAQIAALLTAFQMRSITVDELIGFREALMETRLPIDFAPYRPIDIVGTGGDGKNTFNISTCACFVVAGAGYKVAKHGNYGATSVSGASNVIEQHGVRFTNNPDTLKRSMEECNIAYLHAQLFNPAMKFVGPVRKTLGVRTLFNLLGPLVNPCCPAYQLLGVADLSQMRLYTNVFYKLGIDFAVVNSLDSYDEISLTDEFKVMTAITSASTVRRLSASRMPSRRTLRRRMQGRCRPHLRQYPYGACHTCTNAMRHCQRRLCHPGDGAAERD